MATIVTEDFNSLTNGDLVGQNGWHYDSYSTGHVVVEDSVKREGAKGIQAYWDGANLSSFVEKWGNSLTDGRQTFYFKKPANEGQIVFDLILAGTQQAISVSASSDGKIK